MKKLFLLSGLLALGMTVNAQQSKMVLYEEFTGENCPPCAQTNPALDALMTQNASRIIKIQYQSPIPSAGPIYQQNTSVVQSRISYYGVSFAPWGEMDGAIPAGIAGQQNPNHPAYVVNSPSVIDSAYNAGSPFTIDISSYSISGGNVSATINVTANQAVTASNLKVRVALVESLEFASAPGSNGETEFPNVVRDMYPNTTGQSAPSTWTNGQSQAFSISGNVPSYVDLNNQHFLVVWIQDDGNKEVLQAARTYPPNDVASMGVTSSGTNGLNCGLPYTATNPTVTISNQGSNNLTSATIYYKEAGASSWQSQNWTGNLALNQTAQVALPNITITEAGMTGIIDSVGNPNGTTDAIKGNNTSSVSITALANTNGVSLPVSNDLENGNNGWVPYAAPGDMPLVIYSSQSNVGYNSSAHFLMYRCYQLQSGSGYYILPFSDLPGGAKALDFYVAYAQYDNNGTPFGNDKLEVVYSTDCGQSWTSVWNEAGASLATVSPSAAEFIPSGNSDWKLKSVDMSNVPNGAQIALRATSDYGNNLLVDNIQLRTGPTTAIEKVVANANSLNIYPNPVNNNLNIDLDLVKSASVTFSIVNVLGQQVSNVTKDLMQGKNSISLSASSLAAGTYIMNIKTDAGTLHRKFIKK